MARDRLAAMRAQQGGAAPQDPYNNIPERSVPQQQQQPTQDYSSRYNNQATFPAGAGAGGNPYAQQDSYEMGSRNGPPTANANGAGYGNGADDMSNFYAEITSIQEDIRAYQAQVQKISELHSKSLNSVDEAATRQNESQLSNAVDETRATSSVLKRRIQALEKQSSGNSRDAQIKKQQIERVKSNFKEAIQNYSQMESQFRAKYKQRMERQIKIVNPNATPDEVRAVVESSDGNNQVFQNALMQSERYGQSRAAYREVQERHADIQRIERTITELAQLFNDMSVLVAEQDDALNVIETQAATADRELEQGVKHTDKAVVSARAARRKRWICFFILLLIIIIVVAVVVGVVVSNNNKKN